MVTTIPDIPRIYTAIAEWSACLIFISIFKLRYEKGKTTLISIAFLLGMSVFMETTANVFFMFISQHIYIWRRLCDDSPS